MSEQEPSLAQQFYGSTYQAPASQPAYASHQAAPSSQASPYNLYQAQDTASQAPYGGFAPQSSYQQPQAQAPAQQQGYSQYSPQPAQNSHYAMPAAAAEPAAPAVPSGPEPSQVGNCRWQCSPRLPQSLIIHDRTCQVSGPEVTISARSEVYKPVLSAALLSVYRVKIFE